MKTLYLIRHSKSDWANEALADIDRPLNARGYTNAHEMGVRLKKKNEIPQLIISSNAIRAMSTAAILLGELGLDGENYQVNERLYDATVDGLMQELRSIDNRYKVVFVVCHNPGITHIVNRIADAAIDAMPTTGVACIDLPLETWASVGDSEGKLRYFDFPRNKD